MNEWIRKGSGILAGLCLSLGLGGHAYAAEPEEPAPAPVQEDQTALPAEKAPAGEAATPVEETKTEPTAPALVSEAKAESASPAPASETKAEAASPAPASEANVEAAVPVAEGEANMEAAAATAPESGDAAEETAPVPAGEAIAEAAAVTEESAEEAHETVLAPAETTEVPTVKKSLKKTGSVVLKTTAADGENTGEGAVPSAAAAEITLGQERIGGSDGSGSGWSYDKESERLALVNYGGETVQDLSSQGDGDVTIVAAGLNRLGTIACGGSVNLLGTGILLVDEIQMADNSEFRLLTNTDLYDDGTGSVAVFLKSGENEYTLINGELPGLLDEEYTVPDGITLVVPEDSQLQIRSIYAKTVLDPDAEPTIVMGAEVPTYRVETYTRSKGEDTDTVKYVESKASLSVGRMDSQGSIVMQTLDALAGNLYKASLTLREAGSQIAKLILQGDVWVSLAGGTEIGELAAESGDSRLILQGDTQVDTLDTTGGTFTVNSGKAKDEETTLTVTTEILGQGLIVDSARLVLEENCTFDAGTIKTEIGDRLTTPVIINNSESSALPFNSIVLTVDRKDESLATVHERLEGELQRLEIERQNEPSLTPEGEIQIPFYRIYTLISQSVQHYYYTTLQSAWKEERYAVPAEWQVEYEEGPGGYQESTQTAIYSMPDESTLELSYGDLVQAYKDTWHLEDKDLLPILYFELVLREADGSLSVRQLNSTDTKRIAIGDLCLIRAVEAVGYQDGTMGSTVTSTTVSLTGAGVLGGSGAGSVHSGRSTVIRKGAQPADPVDPDPVDPDPVDPDPVNPDPVDPDPVDPDPVDPDPVNPDPVDPDPVDPDPVNPDPVDPDPVKPDPVDPDPAEETQTAQQVWQVVVTENVSAHTYTLHIYAGDRPITDPGGGVRVQMDYELPTGWDNSALYAVFRGSNGKLHAVAASYDPATGILYFDARQTGDFVIVSFPFDGEPFTDAFYAALAKLEAVRYLK